MSRVGWAATLGALTGAIGLALAMVPSVTALEDSIGLRWLFLLRGAVAPPTNVAIVNVDEDSAASAGLPRLFRDWPRSTHASLVDRLVERGVSAVAFDVEFFRHGVADEDDLKFGQALTRARRVVLVQRFEVARTEGREIWGRRNPIPSLADAAFGLAPVPVPDAPFVSWFWSFLPTPGLGDVPSMPAVVLQIHAMPVLGSFLDLLRRAGVKGLEEIPQTTADIRTPADLLRVMQTIRRQVIANPSAASTVRARLRADDVEVHSDRQKVAALVEMYAGRDTSYLNFYGPPGTICTIPYDRLLTLASDEAAGCPLQGSIVFVGLARSRLERADQADTYHTVYESADGVDFSGVELHATALSNLLSRTALRASSPIGHVAVLLLVGVCMGAGGYWVRTRKRHVRGRFPARLQAAAVLVGFVTIYCGVAYLLFANHNLSVPLVIPVAVEFPAALILGLLVPPTRYREQVKAVCLATDAEGSTAVGQRLPNEEYARLLSEYNQTLARPVWLRGGAALAPEGDGFVGLWVSRLAAASPDDIEPECRLSACLTAIEMAEAARLFNLAQGDGKQLPARIGLTVGTVTIHSDADRGVFNVIGDAVNVAARLRDLNRELGSRVLASEDVVKGLETKLRLRPIVGPAHLKGVARPLTVVELIAHAEST
jgi:adenylate cyclase